MFHYITGNRIQLQTLNFEQLIPNNHHVRLFWKIWNGFK